MHGVNKYIPHLGQERDGSVKGTHEVVTILMMLYFLGSVLGTSCSLYYYAYYYVLLHNNFN